MKDQEDFKKKLVDTLSPESVEKAPLDAVDSGIDEDEEVVESEPAEGKKRKLKIKRPASEPAIDETAITPTNITGVR